MKIDIEQLPESSDNLATKEEAIAAIEKYGNPIRIKWEYKTSTVVLLAKGKLLRVPYEAIR